MKKLLAFLFTFAITFSGISCFAAPADISVMVDGAKVEYDVKPIIMDSRTMVPIRKTADMLGAEVTWDDSIKTATITLDGRVVKMKQNDPNIYVNDVRISMDTSAVNVDSRILIPVRYLAEALDSTVLWDHNQRIVEVITQRHYITIGQTKITVGDPVSSIKLIFGEPDRIDSGNDRCDWYVYNSDFSKYMMVGVLDNKVLSVYTAFTDFSVNGGIKYGDVLDEELIVKDYKVYTDKLDGNKVYAAWINSSYSSDRFLKENFDDVKSMSEKQIFDITNAFRHKNGLTVLSEDSVASKVCGKHSQDMADNNYFDHTNLKKESPWDRYDGAGGKYYACTESIAGGEYAPQNTFDSWLNSADHRENLLHKKATFAGVGMGYNSKSDLKFYTTQMFSYQK